MIFDPARASQAAAAFAALLAAILLAVLGTLALSHVRSQDRRHKHEGSLTVGLTLLVSLLATTYMFVLLSGLTAQPSDPRTLTGATPEVLAATQAEAALSLLRGAAFLFIVSGSALAVSAAGTVLFLGIALAESGSPARSVIRRTVHQALIGGIVLDAIFLGFGYDDIANAFLGGGSRWLWTSISAALLAAPLLLAVTVGRRARWVRAVASRLGRVDNVRLVLPGLVWLGALPVLAFLLGSNHQFAGHQDYGNPVGPLLLSAACALWAGLTFAAFILLSRTKIEG